MTGKEEFLNAGGQNYKHIPCLNDNEQWVKVVSNWVTEWEDPASISPEKKIK